MIEGNYPRGSDCPYCDMMQVVNATALETVREMVIMVRQFAALAEANGDGRDWGAAVDGVLARRISVLDRIHSAASPGPADVPDGATW